MYILCKMMPVSNKEQRHKMPLINGQPASRQLECRAGFRGKYDHGTYKGGGNAQNVDCSQQKNVIFICSHENMSFLQIPILTPDPV